MSLLSSIDTSQYTTPYASGMESLHAAGAQAYKEEQAPNVAAVDKETPKVDLSRYYSNVRPTDLKADAKSGVLQASQNLSNAIAAAVTHGMDPQDAVNIQKAKVAYETTISAAKTSTFEIAIE